jgi:hypothetical protein
MVAVVAVGMVQPALDQIVDVIAVRDRLVTTVLAVGMARIAVSRIGVTVGMLGVDIDHVLVDMILVRVMQMPVVDVVDVIAVANRRVTAAFAVHVRVIAFMNRVRHRHTVGRIRPRAKQVMTRPVLGPNVR